MLLLLVAGALGVASAYDRGLALGRFGLIMGGLGLCYAIAWQPDRQHLYIILAFFGLVAVGLTLYYITTADWTLLPVKFPALAWLTEAIARHLPRLGEAALNGNSAGGVLIAFIPFFAPLIVLCPGTERRGGRLLRAFWAGCAGLALLGWLLSSSRGAWLALASVTAVWIVWRRLGRWLADSGREPAAAWSLRLKITGALVIVAGVMAVLMLFAVLAGQLPGGGTLSGRLAIFRNALLLARDYALTGAGLGMYNIQHSIYTLLIHVRHTDHAHNLLLNILVDQGILGLTISTWFFSMILYYGFRWQRNASHEAQWVLQACIASFLALMLHGLVDDVSYGDFVYVFLGFSLGPMLAEARWLDESRPHRRHRRHKTSVSSEKLVLTTLVAGLVIVLLAGWRPLLGSLYANLGAVAQARVELNVYDEARFDSLSMDQVRQQENLDLAISRFRRAIALDPANATARQRLSAIALARGDYGLALEQMEAAWNYGHRDLVTRMLFGDALVADGQVERAVALVEGIDLVTARLHGQAWSRYWINDDADRAFYAWDAVLRLDPGDAHAQYWHAEAAKRRGTKGTGS
jgi:O-antigen ligase